MVEVQGREKTAYLMSRKQKGREEGGGGAAIL